jgi:hypothetical protein
MPAIEAKVIQELDTQIDAVKKNLETAGNEGRDKLKSIKVDEVRQEIPRTNEGKVDPDRWANLEENKQQDLYHRLSLVYDDLRRAAGRDGAKNPHSIMFDEYASNAAIILMTIVSFGLMAVLLGAFIWQWNQATDMNLAVKIQTVKPAMKKVEQAKAAVQEAQDKLAKSGLDEKARQEAQKNLETMTAKQTEAEKQVTAAIDAIPQNGATEATVLMMVILLGALGGTLHLVSSLFKYIGNRQFKRSWVLYYLAMPVTGAGLAPIVYLLLRLGLINPSGASGTGSSLANLNLIAIYAFALLTGMFSRAALDKLGEIFGTIFQTRKPPGKDTLTPEKPPAGTAAGAGKP